MAVRYYDQPEDPRREPTHRGRHYDILKPGWPRPVWAIVLADYFACVQVHWYPLTRQTRCCVRPMGACPGCDAGELPRWKAYIAAEAVNSGRQAIVELTAEAVRRCPELYLEPLPLLRGRLIGLVKSAPGQFAAVAPKMGRLKDGVAIPPEWNLPPVLQRLWGFLPRIHTMQDLARTFRE
jgi:hypothetical protein